jgi:hypothetical protein
VKNLSDAPIAVRGIIYPVGNTRSLKPLSIMSKSLAAGEAEELQLPRSGDQETLNGAAIKLESSGAAASVIATFTSTDPVHGMARSVPFSDTSSYGALTGGYPWRIDGDYSSTVSITNIGRSRAAILAIIRPSGGKDYKFDTRYLEAGETGVFDIRQIRDQQIPDSKGVKLAKNAAGGQFEWSSILGDGSVRLVGRADVTSLSLGVSNTDTFYNCNCPLSTISAFITPGTPFTPVGGETSATTEVVYQSVCNGSEVDQAFAALNWLIQSLNILSLTTKVSPSTMKGLAAGKSNFKTTINGDKWSFSPTAGCTRTPVSVTPQATGTVAIPTSETTAFQSITQITQGQFLMTLYPGAGNYDGHSDKESSPVIGTNTCWWNGSGMAQYPTVQGSTWTVGQGNAGHNQYGLDTVGFVYGVINLIQTQGGAHGVHFPCTVSIYQEMNYDGIDAYIDNLLTQTVGSNTVNVCRTGVCTGTIPF